MNASTCRLETEALLHIKGPDTLAFLQGQTTCDTRRLAAGNALPGVYCTPQGRVVCDFLLLELAPEHVALRMRADIRDNAAAVLGKYIVFSKADIDIQRDDWQVFGCWGPDAAQVLADVLGGAPDGPFCAHASEHAIAVQVDDGGEAFECCIDVAQAPDLAEKLLASAQDGPEEHWRAAQVARGIARIEGATVEAFVPQSLNYDLTGHISFNKGCYTGQEVVARLHYRGTPKRRAYLVALPRPAAAGDKLFADDSNNSVGDIVNVAGDGERLLALVSATAEGIESGLQLGEPGGPRVEVLELPYSLAKD